MKFSLPCRTRGTPLMPFALCALLGSLNALAQPPAAKGATEVIVQPASMAQLTTTIEALGSLRANETITLTSNETKKLRFK